MLNDIVKLKWDGQEYSCPVTMSLIKDMERSGVNILQSAIMIDKGGIPPISLIAELYAHILRAGGCNVTEDEIYNSIMSAPADSVELVAAARVALTAFFPNLDSAERSGKGKGGKKK